MRAEPLPVECVAAKQPFHDTGATCARDASASNRLGDTGAIASALLLRQGIATATVGVAKWNQVRQAALKTGIDGAEAMPARCAGAFEHKPKGGRVKMALTALASEPASPRIQAPATPASTQPAPLRKRPHPSR